MRLVIGIAGAAAALVLSLSAQIVTASCGSAGEAGDETRPVAARPEAAASAEPQSNEFRWRKALAAGRVVEIKGVNGNVRAEQAPAGGEAEVVATKTGRRDDPDDRARRGRRARRRRDHLRRLPEPRRREAERLRARRGRSDERPEQRREGRLRGARARGRALHGPHRERQRRCDGDRRRRGRLRPSTATSRSRPPGWRAPRPSTARSPPRWATPAGRTSCRSRPSTASIDLTFPASLSAEVNAETVNGDIMSDFPLTITGRYSKRKLNGTIGGGGRELHLRTVNGDVMIRRAS